MIKYYLSLLLTLSILLTATSNLLAINGDMGGPTQNGSADYPYLIQDFNDFQVFASDPNYWIAGTHTQLNCDLDLDPNLPSRQTYTTAVIAPDTDDDPVFFKGIFNGNDHIISNLTIDTLNQREHYLGLFGQIQGFDAQIKNIGLENIKITGVPCYVIGGLCGFNNSGNINNCYVTGSFSTLYSADYIGGMIGMNENTNDQKNQTINNCYTNVTITTGEDSEYVGGLCGYNYCCDINNCHAAGTITNGNYSIGGLCGYNYQSSISNCYTTNAVNAYEYSWCVGGLCGYNEGGYIYDDDENNNYNTIINCYTTGQITGGYTIGGLCGDNKGGNIANCYATGEIIGGGSLGGFCGYNAGESDTDSEGTITNCYSTGSVSSNEYPIRNLGGGFCGGNNGIINNCYTTGKVIGDLSIAGGFCGKDSGTITNCYFYILNGPDNNAATALDELQMTDANSYTGFDFADNPADGNDDYWSIVAGHCPKLTWQTGDGPLPPGPIETTLSGSGYSYDPYQINSFADFNEFRTNTDLRTGYYILNINIDLSGEIFTNAIIDHFFVGNFNGNDHIIRNITIDAAGQEHDYLGLFSCIGNSVNNLGLENINIITGDGSEILGMLCGINRGTIENCYATGSIISGNNSRDLGGLCGLNYTGGSISNCYAMGDIIGANGSRSLGGLCGYNYYGTLDNCYATGLVTGDNNLGGLCGKNTNGLINNCYTVGSIYGKSSLGGLCGENDNGKITNCYATGSVNGKNNSINLGGLCGKSEYSSSKISNCYAKGTVISGNNSENLGGLCGYSRSDILNCYAKGTVIGGDNTENLGGLCGYHQRNDIANCFWDIETSGLTLGYNLAPSFSGLITNVTGKTTDEMQTLSTFTNAPASWDFIGEEVNGSEDIWDICDGMNYPRLSWQIPLPGDFVCPDGVDFVDFAVLADTWNLAVGQVGYNNKCDLADDGIIDFADLAIFSDHWLANFE